MTLNNRNHYKSENKKLLAVKEVLENGKPVTEVANEIGVHRATVYNWLNTFKNDGTFKVDVSQSKFTNKPTDFQLIKENRKLKKKLKEQEMENEILKKFQAFLKGNV